MDNKFHELTCAVPFLSPIYGECKHKGMADITHSCQLIIVISKSQVSELQLNKNILISNHSFYVVIPPLNCSLLSVNNHMTITNAITNCQHYMCQSNLTTDLLSFSNMAFIFPESQVLEKGKIAQRLHQLSLYMFIVSILSHIMIFKYSFTVHTMSEITCIKLNLTPTIII